MKHQYSYFLDPGNSKGLTVMASPTDHGDRKPMQNALVPAESRH